MTDQPTLEFDLPPVMETPRTVVVREHLRRVHGDSSSVPRHRNSDPRTSAAAAIRAAGQGVEKAILIAFENHGAHGLTDDELVAYLPDFYPPTTKTARSRLARNGHLHDSGETRASARGREMTVWTLRGNE